MSKIEKEILRKEIEEQTKKFLDRGGKIEKIKGFDSQSSPSRKVETQWQRFR